MEPLNSSNIGEQIPALLPQQNKKAIVIILSSISLVLLLVSIFLFVLLGQTKAKMQGEINTAQNDLKNLKESSEKEILSLKKEIEKIKNPTRINTEETSIEKSPDSRDKKRISDLKSVTFAIGAYYSDKERYPDTSVDGCVSAIELNTNYLPKGVPKDPQNDNINEGCTAPGQYAYRGWVRDGRRIPGYAVSTTLENESLGNSEKSINEYTTEELSSGLYSVLKKGAGKYYIVTN